MKKKLNDSKDPKLIIPAVIEKLPLTERVFLVKKIEMGNSYPK